MRYFKSKPGGPTGMNVEKITSEAKDKDFWLFRVSCGYQYLD